MKREKMINKLKSIGFTYELLYENLYVMNKEGNKCFARVSECEMCIVDTSYDNFKLLNESDTIQLFNLLTEYASTPIEEREEEKKYRYYLKDTTGLKLNHGKLLYKQKGFNNFMFDIDNFRSDEVKCEFTHRELRACGINLTLLQENYKEVEVKEK